MDWILLPEGILASYHVSDLLAVMSRWDWQRQVEKWAGCFLSCDCFWLVQVLLQALAFCLWSYCFVFRLRFTMALPMKKSCQMILLFENCYVNTFFQLDLSHGSALFGHVAMVQGSWTPPMYHNVVACGPCFLCFSLIIAYTTRFLLLPAVEWYLPFSWCLCWRSYNDSDELAFSSLGFSDLIVDLLRRRPAGQWSFDHWS